MTNKLNIAFIMDGNGRWAKAQGKSRTVGHEIGAEVVREITTYCSKHLAIKSITLYAFSTENWKRPKTEVLFLMQLLERYLKKELDIYLLNNVRFIAIGDTTIFSNTLQKVIHNIEEKTKQCTGLIQYLAINYGAKDELIRSIKKTIDKKEEITPDIIQKNLDMPLDIDLLIRTGGNQRISNFLLWQNAYAELFFTQTLWPDFTPKELETIISKFYTIERRFGDI